MGVRKRRPTPWQADREQLNVQRADPALSKARKRTSKIDGETFKFSHPWKRRLWAIAKERDMRLPDVARAAGVSRHHLWLVMSESRDITTATLADICRGLNLSATWLLFGVGGRECIAK